VNPEAEITLRPAQDADRDFLLAVYASTRAEEMARVPWSAEQKAGFISMQFTAQSNHYKAEYPAAEHEIISVNGAPAGRLYLNRGEKAIHVLDMTVLPEFRNRGIGEFLLRRIMEEGAKSGKPVTIYVESFNPAQRLFGRLGFERAGEQGFNWLLCWTPGGRQ
jgi:ribosomal protein S18 acetylase RimI-like enzyme